MYGLKACSLNKSDIRSLDFVVNRFFMKLFFIFSYFFSILFWVVR